MEEMQLNKNDDDEWQFSDENSRKVRSTITNNHSTILKAYYNFNPRPKRADIIKISEQIGMYSSEIRGLCLMK